MSDNWITIIPEDPYYLPETSRQLGARNFIAALDPEADKFDVAVSKRPQFLDCGANFERITCHSCGAELDSEWWQNRMDEDYNDGGFMLNRFPVPCCGKLSTLAELHYDWPQGFARFAVSAMNPNIETLTDEQKRELEGILGAPFRVIYRHI